MRQAKESFLGGNEEGEVGFLQLSMAQKVNSLMEEYVVKRYTDFANMLGILDGIWSHVREIDTGFLPTP
eukprot:scaffold23192_cov30-Attheya_sp.AAC.1